MKSLPKKWSDKEIEFLKKNLNLTDKKIGEKLERSLYSVRGKRIALGFKKIDATVKHSIDIDFFKKWSPNMAYILGFIFADGFIRIRKNGSVLTIGQRSPAILKKINNAMGSNYPIKKEISREYYRIAISRKEIVNSLIELGVENRKSKKMKFPNLPKIYFWHFLRGYFDGDGHVSIVKNFPVVGFTSGSLDFLKRIKKILEIHHKIPCSLHIQQKKYYGLNILSQEKRRFFENLYENAELFLERKYEIIYTFYREKEQTKRKCKRCGIIIGNYLSKKNYCNPCKREARLESYRRYDIKRNRRRN
ncbi:MAG: hypothetical protein HeimAB125_08140 [Candidatus Heimdallarchaeota archaeon AB_125]|nr:MAG: hypothetical protein HeimAB125_08140 [Candidatus Heimdallarchaeota archaeon AB_125]